MSNIFNQLIEKRNEEFNRVVPAGASVRDIKPGQVIIERIMPIPVGINGEVMVGFGNWKPSEKSAFYEGQIFKMDVDVLYNRHTKGEKEIPVTELPSKLLSVSEPAIAYQIENKKPMATYNVKWKVSNEKPEVVTPKNAGIYVLFANAKTLGEAAENVTNTCRDSLLAYYELEAEQNRFDSGFNHIEDALYDNIGDCIDGEANYNLDFNGDQSYDYNN